MPFINVQKPQTHKTLCYNLCAAQPHVGVSFVALWLAAQYVKENKHVLIFDTMLGLGNIPVKNKNAKSLEQVLQGTAPLTNIIFTYQDIDIISGSALLNLNALSPLAQGNIKHQLTQLIPNYDVVICDTPAAVEHPFLDAPSIWVTTPDQSAILKTLRRAGDHPTLILNKVQNDSELQAAVLFIHQIVPETKIQQAISVKK
ncbi:MAG: hypothetical protein II942_04280 [Alphaproteobacteria bacterium]|nr:hypothetical protein [Alphaproteobacteria bacterium]